jgi:hypothetical protein
MAIITLVDIVKHSLPRDCRSSHWTGRGKRLRGRPRKSCKACVLEDATNFTGVDNNTVKALASDRVQWISMIRHQRDVCDAGHLND